MSTFLPFGFPYRIPNYGYPNKNYYNYKYKNNSNNITSKTKTNNTVTNEFNNIQSQDNSIHKKNTFFKSIGPLKFNFNSIGDINYPILDFLGIQLFLDDLIIIGLLLFLYQEKVNDEILYIILFMLLLS